VRLVRRRVGSGGAPVGWPSCPSPHPREQQRDRLAEKQHRRPHQPRHRRRRAGTQLARLVVVGLLLQLLVAEGADVARLDLDGDQNRGGSVSCGCVFAFEPGVFILEDVLVQRCVPGSCGRAGAARPSAATGRASAPPLRKRRRGGWPGRAA